METYLCNPQSAEIMEKWKGNNASDSSIGEKGIVYSPGGSVNKI